MVVWADGIFSHQTVPPEKRGSRCCQILRIVNLSAKKVSSISSKLETVCGDDVNTERTDANEESPNLNIKKCKCRQKVMLPGLCHKLHEVSLYQVLKYEQWGHFVYQRYLIQPLGSS